jgi:hypothetical protein
MRRTLTHIFAAIALFAVVASAGVVAPSVMSPAFAIGTHY